MSVARVKYASTKTQQALAAKTSIVFLGVLIYGERAIVYMSWREGVLEA